jgi:hypothetical protein
MEAYFELNEVIVAYVAGISNGLSYWLLLLPINSRGDCLVQTRKDERERNLIANWFLAERRYHALTPLIQFIAWQSHYLPSPPSQKKKGAAVCLPTIRIELMLF